MEIRLAPMRFRCLGPLEVWDGERWASPSGGKARAALAALIVRAGRHTPADHLVQDLWGDAPPASCRTLVRGYVLALRRLLGDRGAEVIQYRNGGYRLNAGREAIDAACFEDLCDEAGRLRARGELGRAHQVVEQALSLWRGPVMEDVPVTSSVATYADILGERRLTALEWRIEGDLRGGRAEGLVEELVSLVAEQPFREGLAVQLMRALHLSGRRPEALRFFAGHQRRLREDLGVGPGPELRRAHEEILLDERPRLPGRPPVSGAGRHRPGTPADSSVRAAPTAPQEDSTALDTGAHAGAGQGADAHRDSGAGRRADAHRDTGAGRGTDAPPGEEAAGGERPRRQGAGVPMQTPACPADFTGREELVERWTTALAAEGPRALRTLAISGRAGVGKTTLAVHLAHRLRDDYPDGQLWADFSGDVTPVTVLGQILRSLGVPGPSVPEPLDERVLLYRSLLAGRRVLVLVDNADAEPQIRALQPGSAGCAVVATSRRRLLGLASASFVDLDVLGPDAAMDLLSKIVTDGRVQREPAAALEIAELCGRLPLAVRIAGARATARPSWPLSAFAAELRDETSRLDRLKAGDLDVKAAIGASYAGLDEPHRRLFRLLGLLDAPDFPQWAAAALTGAPQRLAQDRLYALAEARLVDEVGPDAAGRARFRLHDLIRIFARHRAETEDDAATRRAALTRALGGWLLLAEEADARLPARTVAELRPAASRWRPDAADDPDDPDDPDGARRLGHPDGADGTDRAHHLDGADDAHRPDGADGVEAMVGDPFTWFEAERRAIAAAVRQAAALGETPYAWGLASAAQGFYELRDTPEGTWTHRLALAACRRAGDRLGEAVMLRNLADLHSGKSGTAPGDKLESAGAATEIFRELGERRGEADALYLCGDAHRMRGDHDLALSRLRESLAIARACGYPLGELHVLQQFAIIDNERSHFEEARAHAEQAMAIARRLASPRDESVARALLGVIHKRCGRFAEGGEQLRVAVAKAQASADPLLEAMVLAHLGQLYADHGHPDARATLERGLARSAACHYDFGRAIALHGLGRLETAEGRPEQGIDRLHAAAALWERLQHAYGKARTTAALSEAYAANGDLPAARRTLIAACRQYRDLGDEKEAARLSALLWESIEAPL
ncbi:AfsR/SARP family transcriptional regulator [Sphaerisporangium sp. NPDC004334]